jgi:D-alanyl-D-alanine carboxypeptidase
MQSNVRSGGSSLKRLHLSFATAIAVLVCFAVVSALLIVIDGTNRQDPMHAATATTTDIGYTAADIRTLQHTLADSDIRAHAVHVWDVNREQTLYQKNATAQLPLASITKLMTALAASQSLSDNEAVTVTLDAIETEGYSTLRAGEQWHWSDLLDYTLVRSSNDGAEALAAAAVEAGNVPGSNAPQYRTFTDRMNTHAQRLGMHQTYFMNETGLDTNESVSGAYGSARDVSVLLSHLVQQHPHLIDVTRKQHISRTSLAAREHSATNTNEIIGTIPGLLASKTGYTDLAGGNLTVAFDLGINHPIVVTVLGSTRSDRFSDVATIVEAARASLVAHSY